MPAIGQGAVGIECRVDDERINGLLAPLTHGDTAIRVTAERALNNRLNGGCQVPVAGYSLLQNDQIWLRGLIGYPDGSAIYRAERTGPIEDAESIGVAVAEELLAKGGRAVLDSIGIHVD